MNGIGNSCLKQLVGVHGRVASTGHCDLDADAERPSTRVMCGLQTWAGQGSSAQLDSLQ